MPLYLEDLPASAFSYPMVAVLKMIALDVDERPINPAIAAEVIRHFVGLMIPPEHHRLLVIEGQPSWDKVRHVEVALAFASDEFQLRELAEASVIVRLVCEHSTRPPRKWKVTDTVEVASFIRMAGYIKLAVKSRHAVVNGRKVDLLSFCKYCWRPATNAAKVCLFHSVQKRGDEASSAEYKQAQRLHKAFETQINRLAAIAELGFHGSEFTSPVFFPDSNANNWLALHRSTLHAALSDAGIERWTLAQLCGYLYGDEGVAEQLTAKPQVLTPVTLRAEAWLIAVRTRPNWGGVRKPRKSTEQWQHDVRSR